MGRKGLLNLTIALVLSSLMRFEDVLDIWTLLAWSLDLPHREADTMSCVVVRIDEHTLIIARTQIQVR